MTVKDILLAVLMAADRALDIAALRAVFEDTGTPVPDSAEILDALADIAQWCDGQPQELRQVAGGYRLQVRAEYAPWVQKLWEDKPVKYSRALLETLALIAYRQPITRGEIEDIRGVSVSTQIMRTLQEREWIRVVGHKDVPGRPAMFGTTKAFLDYFNLTSLGELPDLLPVRELQEIEAELLQAEASAPRAEAYETQNDTLH